MNPQKSPEGALDTLLTRLQKKWDDCTTDEKLDKLRAEIGDLRYMSQRIENDVESLREHSHIDGKVSVPFKKTYGGNSGVSRMDYLV